MLFKTYFSARYVLSKNAILNLCLSDRSDGKTFDCKARALEDYEKNKDIKYLNKIDLIMYSFYNLEKREIDFIESFIDTFN